MLPCEALLHSDINTCLGDVGGQKTLRTYWKNYFEKTDTLIWVVDSTDRERLADCRQELEGLLVQEVRVFQNTRQCLLTISQRLMGASLLVFKNKSDVAGSMTEDEIREVCLSLSPHGQTTITLITDTQGLHLDNIHTHKWRIMTCSAMTGENLQEGLQWVVQDAKDRLFLY
jgi:ADP-ribosylation factor-like protein 2